MCKRHDLELGRCRVDHAAQCPSNGAATRFLYAGNLGYTQGFETLIDACRLTNPGIEL